MCAGKKAQDLSVPLQVSNCHMSLHQAILSRDPLLTKQERGYRWPSTCFFLVLSTGLGSCKSHVLWEIFQDIVLQEYFTNIGSIANPGKCSGCRTLIKIARQESDQNIERKSLKRHLLDIYYQSYPEPGAGDKT